MANPQPSDDELARIYGEDYFLVEKNEVGQTDVDELKQGTADLYLDLLERYRGKEAGRLLEIGCGQGDFLVRAAARSLTVTGIEYSEHACEVARRKLRNSPELGGPSRRDQFPFGNGSIRHLRMFGRNRTRPRSTPFPRANS